VGFVWGFSEEPSSEVVEVLHITRELFVTASGFLRVGKLLLVEIERSLKILLLPPNCSDPAQTDVAVKTIPKNNAKYFNLIFL